MRSSFRIRCATAGLGEMVLDLHRPSRAAPCWAFRCFRIPTRVSSAEKGHSIVLRGLKRYESRLISIGLRPTNAEGAEAASDPEIVLDYFAFQFFPSVLIQMRPSSLTISNTAGGAVAADMASTLDVLGVFDVLDLSSEAATVASAVTTPLVFEPFCKRTATARPLH